MTYLKEDITIYADGGGKVSAARQPIIGRDNCIAFLTKLYNKLENQLVFKISLINGENGIICYDKQTGIADTVILLTMEDNIISTLYFIRNPDKITSHQKFA
jgi:RNA polymerase sigma-70 factor (ECF subfamily)